MKSKIIGLLLVIPLLLIFTTSSVVKTAEILVDVPVQEVVIEGENVRTVDISAEDNKVYLNATVLPESAANKKITYSTEAVEGAPEAQVIISNEGVVTPLSAGTVRVIATADNGRTASVQLVFYSSSALGANVIIQNHTLEEGGSITLAKGTDYAVSPADATFTSEWSSSDATVATVNKRTGIVYGVSTGTATVFADIQGKQIAADGSVTLNTYRLSFGVTVSQKETETGISFSGEPSATRPTMGAPVDIPFTYTESKIAEYGELTLEYDTDAIRTAEISYENGAGRISVALRSAAVEGDTYPISIKAANGQTITTIFVVKAVLSRAELDVSSTTLKLLKSNQPLPVGLITDAVSETSYAVEYFSSDKSVFTVQTIGNECWLTPVREGTATLTATLKKPDGTAINFEIEPLEFTVVAPYIVLAFEENSKVFGLEREFAFGKFNYSGNALTSAEYTLSLRAQLSTDTALSAAGAGFDASKLTFTSSDEEIATVNADGVLQVKDKSGPVTITVSSVYNAVFSAGVENAVSASFTLNCRKDAVNVSDYDTLMRAVDSGYETVVQADIMLAPRLSDKTFAGYMDYLKNVCTKTMRTTADDSYYQNNGDTDARVRYCVEFKNDVYGNGHYINANYITRSYDMYKYSVFNGPLDIVRIAWDNSSEHNAAVKAQDNIVFLVREDDVSLRNVELKGCSDSVVDGNLSNLDNCGTVLEIVGDNCNVEYCRVNNGRTVVRIFGKPMTSSAQVDANPAAYRITADVGNCILSYGREFILKIGSNQAVKNPSASGNVREVYATQNHEVLHNDAAPYLKKRDGGNYAVTDTKDDYFYERYVMTDLTLRNSVFRGAGLFCIGFESKFAGLCLHGYDFSENYKFGSELGWKNLAGTSYPAVIRLQGDVRFYDWKKVNDVNSDTLIEGSEDILALTGLNINVASLIDRYNASNASALTITKGGEKYVNGAIAFYGGGKNYSYVDASGVSSSFNALTDFTIELSYLASSGSENMVYFSAGVEPFRFLLYSSSSSLNIDKQEADIKDNNAYSWLYRS